LDKATLRSLSRFFVLMLVAVLIGLIQGEILFYLLLALAGYLLWHLWHLYRFEAWVKGGAKEDTPDFPGAWGDIVSFIIRTKRRSRERKQRYKELIRQFRVSSSALPDGTVLLAKNNQIIWFNKAARGMLGLNKSSDRGQRIENLLRRPDFIEYLREESPKDRLVMPAPHEPGRHYSIELVPYGQAQGQRLMLIKDVTREVLSEKMRRDFVANASHELRTPLTVLTGYLESMHEDDSLDTCWSGPIEEMQTQTARMTEIVTDLLTLSRLEAPETVMESQPVNVVAMLSALRKNALAIPGCPATIEVEASSRARLLGDESDLYSAFGNLVENAVKYTPEDGRIRLCWSDGDKGSAVFSVSDTGLGIDAKDIPRVTERFYRVDKGRARNTGGTGLGLAIVNHVLNRHEAELSIASEQGTGSAFSCVFPAQRVLREE